MKEINFKPYMHNQNVLFPSRIDEDIEENDPVRMINGLIDQLDLRGLYSLYYGDGCPAYHPKMMLKVIIYAYINNIYSCRKIEKALKRDIHFIWLAGYDKPDFITINRFRNRAKDVICHIFTQVVLLLATEGYVTLDVEYIDGTKIESKANKYSFVWKKTVEKNRAKLMEKIRVLLAQIDDEIAQENTIDNEEIEFTPSKLVALGKKLSDALAKQPEPQTKEEEKARRDTKRKIKELGETAEKMAEYDEQLDKIGERNSMSKTDPDATFMRMKEDHMNNGQTKPAYNLQIGTENQFITDFGLFHNPNDTRTFIPFLNSFRNRYGSTPGEAVADSGYGSEENYSYMEGNDITPYVKYNYFHTETRPKYKPNEFGAENLFYNADEDYFVCPMEQHMNLVGVNNQRTPGGYVIQTKSYMAQNCQGCPLRGQCYKAKSPRRTIDVNHTLNRQRKRARELLTSEDGIKHRGKRCIEPEAVFGQMKYNMGYKRFRHFGKDKVTMDFAFFAIAFNLKKMCAVRAKKAKKQEIAA